MTLDCINGRCGQITLANLVTHSSGPGDMDYLFGILYTLVTVKHGIVGFSFLSD